MIEPKLSKLRIEYVMPKIWDTRLARDLGGPLVSSYIILSICLSISETSTFVIAVKKILSNALLVIRTSPLESLLKMGSLITDTTSTTSLSPA